MANISAGTTNGQKPCDLLVFGLRELITLDPDSRGNGMIVDLGKIVEVGEVTALRRKYAARHQVDGNNLLALPSFIDGHTHPAFAVGRAAEFDWRAQGLSYQEIAARGGGIHSSVKAVRECDPATLTEIVAQHFRRMQRHGTSYCEAKSGYGLSLVDELKSLRAIHAAAAQTGMQIRATCLAAHMVPLEFKQHPERYLQLLCAEILPAVQRSGLAQAADVFIETGAFDLVSARTYLECARELGFGLRVHADQFDNLGGTELAVELGAECVDHLEALSDAGLEALALSGKTHVGLLPTVPHFLRQAADAPARRLIQAEVPYFIATDFNPGSSYTPSLPEAAHFARIRMNLTAMEALQGVTTHAADSLKVGDSKGRLAPGYDADWVLCDLPDVDHFGYAMGENPVRRLFVGGQEIDLNPAQSPA
jgi:imidazolonepropionase